MIIKYLLTVIFSLFTGLSWAENYKYPYNSFKDRDPLRPLINERGEILIKDKKEMGDFLLQGIIHSSDGNTVVINNELFKEGDIVEGYKIKKIGIFKVILEKDGEEFILKWEG